MGRIKDGGLTMARDWTTTEVAALRNIYPSAGPAACAEAIPGRPLHAIYAKARVEGLSAPRVSSNSAGKRFARKYPNEEWIDSAIRGCFAAPMKRGSIATLAVQIGRPRPWVQRRARELGLGKSGTQAKPWSREELEIVERSAMLLPRAICAKLKQAGFARSEVAVAQAIKRKQFDTHDPDTWSADELAVCLGVSGKTVSDWIARRGLPAERKGTAHPHDPWVIKRAKLRKWVAANPGYIDLRKVQQAWFMDLAFGPAT